MAISIIVGFIGLALLAVVVGSGQTTGLLAATGNTLSALIGKAVNA